MTFLFFSKSVQVRSMAHPNRGFEDLSFRHPVHVLLARSPAGHQARHRPLEEHEIWNVAPT